MTGLRKTRRVAALSKTYNGNVYKNGKIVSISGLDDPKIEEEKLRIIIETKRKNKIVWKDLPGLSIGTESEIENTEKTVDIRGAATFDQSTYIVTKTAK